METFVLTLKDFDISLKIQTVNRNGLLKIKKIDIIKKEKESKDVPKKIDLLKKIFIFVLREKPQNTFWSF